MSDTIMTIRIDDQLKAQIKESAKKHDRKLAQEIRHILKEYFLFAKA